MGNAMRFVTDLSKGILGEADSPELWAEIISHIPDSVLLKPGVKILNVSCGHGTEADLLVKRMRALGISAQDVNDSIYLLDKYHVFTNPMKRKGYKNVITSDFLKWETDMKFDVVIGNPPYLNGMWREFISKSCELSTRFVGIVAPDGANMYSARGDKIRKEMIAANIQTVVDVTAHFPTINSGKVVRYLFDKSLPANTAAFDQTSIGDRILQKVINITDSKLVCFIGNQSKEFIDTPRTLKSRDSVHIIESISVTEPPVVSYIPKGLAKVFSANEYWFVTRFFGQAANSPVIDCNVDSTISHRLISIKKLGNETSEQFRSVYCSPLFRLIIKIAKNGKFDTPMFILKQLPVVDLTRTWTDQELYAHFGLTQEEIDYVEANVK